MDEAGLARLRDLQERLRLLRLYVAALDNPELNDLDALLSVAEGEVERAMHGAIGAAATSQH
jgi:hypothetical protein